MNLVRAYLRGTICFGVVYGGVQWGIETERVMKSEGCPPVLRTPFVAAGTLFGGAVGFFMGPLLPVVLCIQVYCKHFGDSRFWTNLFMKVKYRLARLLDPSP
jgi:hypothetical protein